MFWLLPSSQGFRIYENEDFEVIPFCRKWPFSSSCNGSHSSGNKRFVLDDMTNQMKFGYHTGCLIFEQDEKKEKKTCVFGFLTPNNYMAKFETFHYLGHFILKQKHLISEEYGILNHNIVS